MKNVPISEQGIAYPPLTIPDEVVHGAVSVGTEPTLILAASTVRRAVLIQNLSANDLCCGGPAVSMSNAPKIHPDGDVEIYGCAAIYGIASGPGSDVRYLVEG